VASALAEAGISVRDAGLRRPTIDDVFLELTGQRAEAPAGDDADEDAGDAPEQVAV
jgi:ABC-2 type transport system ATP-binding protein